MTRTFIVIDIALGCLAIALVIAFLPHQFGANKHADPVTHQCEQTEAVTCGPAACVSALSWVGIDTTERAMVTACKTGPSGTYFPELANALHAPIQSMPLSAPGRTFVVYINDTSPHFICAHDDVVRGWLVNDPWQPTGPVHYTVQDFGNANGAVEVKP